jgi:hypothetical protein
MQFEFVSDIILVMVPITTARLMRQIEDLLLFKRGF